LLLIDSSIAQKWKDKMRRKVKVRIGLDYLLCFFHKRGGDLTSLKLGLTRVGWDMVILYPDGI
ncbi:hypothetical protein GOODEAATRI_015490, partial [Goodea atripinnis]